MTISIFHQFADQILNAMGSARLEIMDERDEDKLRETSPQETVAQQKVNVVVLAYMKCVLSIATCNVFWRIHYNNYSAKHATVSTKPRFLTNF